MANTPKTFRNEDEARRAGIAKAARERDEAARKEKAGISRLIDPAAGDDVQGKKLDININAPAPQPRDFGEEAPSQLRNNMDQIAQPTGDGGIAGGKIPPVGETGNEKAPNVPKTVLVELIKHYVPKGEFEVVKASPSPIAGTGNAFKLWKGTTLRVSPEEAREMDNAGIASRAVETR